MRALVGAAVLVGVLLLSGCGGNSGNSQDVGAAPLEALPFNGKTPTGQRFQLTRGPRQQDDVPVSWCLRLRYDTGITIVDRGGRKNSLAGGSATCGLRPKPVSGAFQAYCKRGSIFLFGGASSKAGQITLVTSKGKRIRAQQAKAPTGSGYRGTVFLVTASVADLPVRLRSEAGRVPGTRSPTKKNLCVPFRGAPEGGEPFGDFP